MKIVARKAATTLYGAALCVALMLVSMPAWSLDTTETFEQGALDLEIFAGFHGFSGGRHFEGFDFEAALNYGLVDRFSIYGKGQIGSNGDFTAATGGAAFGILGNPLDTDHFDLDLMVEFGFGDYGVAVIPAVELNFDLVPDLKKWGMYLRVEEIIMADMNAGGSGFTAYTAMTFGTYWAIVEGHKVLAEYDMQFANMPAAGERTVDVGRVALGYNLGIGNNVDMINEVHCDIPQSGEKAGFGFSIGFKIYGINHR
ncbi:MAG TPA: hypothetical protein PLY68_09930 [Myxococcota bacterium]|nr:hypothetical protein [Myxococcota bacterium]HOD07609.1 hypothetical protein [Myxococcota bacterium]HPB51450.1 hypothetical protein [Myxococcota bacterium]HQP96497.1 hypothetical protein [Myxococcota bacterium]